MKLNEISGGTVWVIVGDEEYNAQEVYGLYSSKPLAQEQLDFIKSKWSANDLRERDPRIITVPLNKKITRSFPMDIISK